MRRGRRERRREGGSGHDGSWNNLPVDGPASQQVIVQQAATKTIRQGNPPKRKRRVLNPTNQKQRKPSKRKNQRDIYSK